MTQAGAGSAAPTSAAWLRSASLAVSPCERATADGCIMPASAGASFPLQAGAAGVGQGQGRHVLTLCCLLARSHRLSAKLEPATCKRAAAPCLPAQHSQQAGPTHAMRCACLCAV